MKPDPLGGGAGLHADSNRNGGGRRFLGMDGALPAEDAAFVDDQRADHDVTEDFAGGQDLQAARGVDVTLDRPADDDIAAADVALDPAVLADRQVNGNRSEEHTSELQSQSNLVCRLLLEKKKKK